MYARSHLSTFTPISGSVGFRYDSSQPIYSRGATDETPGYQAYNSYKRLTSDLHFSCRGSVYDNTLNIMSLASQSSITLSPMLVRAYRWTFRKVWPKTDESSPEDGDIKSWKFGVPTHYLSFTGVVESATGPVMATKDVEPLSFTNDLFGTFSANFIVERFATRVNYTRPEWPIVDVSGRFTGVPTYTTFEDPATASHDFTWLLPDVATDQADDPIEGTATVGLVPGESVAANMVMYDVSIITHALLNTPQPHASTQMACRLVRTIV
jgi:hypothetical protein